ncbi:MAG: acyl-CoA dehydratase activase [Anaerolineales bacterium]
MGDLCAFGIDVGSATVKIVGVDEQGNLEWYLLEPADARVEQQVERFLARAGEAGAGNPAAVPTPVPLVATGYGRKLVRQASGVVTEITCHAKGVFRELQQGGTLVDIGGQDSKVISIGTHGEVLDFAMNDKCAAGTGRFLENAARRLDLPLERLGPVALASAEEVTLSSTCTVFAESEVVSLLAHGVPVEPIVRGLHRSLIKRVVAMIRSVGLRRPLMLSGGVVQNPAIVRLLQEETGEEILLPHHPQLMGAYGAALVALESGNSGRFTGGKE